MMQVDAKTYATGAEMIDAYRLLQQRLRQPPPRKPVLKLVDTSSTPEPAVKSFAIWQRSETHFDAHVIAYREWLAGNGSPAKRHIRDRAVELGFTYADMMGHDRRYPVVAARQLIMWEIKTIFGKTFPEIGRLFNGRDHTTIIWAVRKIERMKAEGKI